MALLKEALKFAEWAHRGQTRKYTGVPYIEHPKSVARIVATVTRDNEMLAAALLHDTVEDTETTLHGIFMHFGPRIAQLVENLTDPSQKSDGNRATRRAIDRAHSAKGSSDAKTIKLADLIDNTISIVEHDPRFARVYMAEKRLLLPFLQEGNPKLYRRATSIVDAYYEKMN